MKNTRLRWMMLVALALLLALPAQTVLAQYDEYIWQTFQSRTISDQWDPQMLLEEEIQAIVSAGHLAPFRFVYGERAEDGRYYYWSNPGDVIFALSYAYPHVSPALQSQLANYIRNEIVSYPPWNAQYLYVDEGARREYCRVPNLSHERLAWWSCKESEHPWLQNLYGLWLYAHNTGDWSLIQSNWNTTSGIKSFYEARRSNDLGFYAGVGGAIGYARMADHLGYTSDRNDAVNRIQTALGGSFSDFELRAEDVLDSYSITQGCQYGPGSGILHMPVTYDISPEVGRYLHENKYSEISSRFDALDYVNPVWYMNKGVLSNDSSSEITFLPPNAAWGAYLAEVFALQRPGAELVKHVGASYTQVGDLYYIVKLASAIGAHGATLWMDVRGGSGARDFSMPLSAGWHLLSYPYQLSSDAVANVLASLNGSYDLVYYYNASDAADPWKVYDVSNPNPPASDLSRLPLGSGFWVHLTQADTWTLSGTPVSGQQIQLYAGFNMVGWPSQEVAELPSALDGSIAGLYEVVWGFDGNEPEDPWLSYDPNGGEWSNTLARLAPGYGSWLYITQSCTLVLPD